MHYRQLGRTDMHVSLLSLGASALGGVFADIDPAQGIRMVHEAVAQGVNFIDVAPYYGFTKAEAVLGQALRTLPRPQYLLSTKVGRYGQDGVKTWDYSAARVAQSVEESLARLHTDYLDLLSVHDVEFADLEQVIHETIPALQALKVAGKVRYVGITGLPLAKLRYILDQVPAGTLDTVLSFCHYCLNDDVLGEHAAYFEEHNVGVINAAPLAMGLLSAQGPPAWHPASASLKEHVQRAAAHCAERGYPIEKLAIQFAVSHPSVATTLVSAACPRLMRQNIEWAATPPEPRPAAPRTGRNLGQLLGAGYLFPTLIPPSHPWPTPKMPALPPSNAIAKPCACKLTWPYWPATASCTPRCRLARNNPRYARSRYSGYGNLLA